MKRIRIHMTNREGDVLVLAAHRYFEMTRSYTTRNVMLQSAITDSSRVFTSTHERWSSDNNLGEPPGFVLLLFHALNMRFDKGTGLRNYRRARSAFLLTSQENVVPGPASDVQGRLRRHVWEGAPGVMSLMQQFRDIRQRLVYLYMLRL